MRSGFAVVSVCLIIAVIFGVRQYQQFKTDLVATQDLVLGLLYFMEQHDGRFPASEAEFRAAPFVKEMNDGSIQIVAPETTEYRPQTHGYVIQDLAPFQVRWGADLSSLHLDQRGVVQDAEGRKVELVRWPGSPRSGKTYARMLVAESVRLRERPAQTETTPSQVDTP